MLVSESTGKDVKGNGRGLIRYNDIFLMVRSKTTKNLIVVNLPATFESVEYMSRKLSF
jgi:hypothetical protein